MTLSVETTPRDLPMAGEPLYERLAEHYRRVIAAGTLAPGDRMPSVRALMQRHQVSLSTALQVFRQLEDAGWLQAKPRSGYFVRRRTAPLLPSVGEPDNPSVPMEAQFVGLHESISKVIAQAQRFPDALNLGGATAAAPLYPTARLQALTIKILRHQPTLLTEAAGDAAGAALRQAIAKRALSAGMTLSPDEVIATTGGVEAVNLALRAVTQAGDSVAIESPAFFGLLQIIESLGLRALEISTSPTTGMSLEALEMAMHAYGNIKAVVVVPHLQNPLGSVMPNERKAGLVRLCARHKVAVIEDEPYRELLDDAAQNKPLKAWDRDGGVIHCASLNKVLAPGLRLGWMSSGRWHARVKMLKYAQSRNNESLSQLVAAEFIGSGAYDRHLFQLRERLRTQRAATADAIARYFPTGTRLSVPVGGIVLWVELPAGTDSGRLFEEALTRGIRIVPGTIFSNSQRFASFIRLSCPQPFDQTLDDALQQLGRLAGEIGRS
ncbi:PLP-dependent aminotransferase family protein [Caballeronia sp. 15711]|uniref:aminotransferase-like domain-containing protein n=1 Tax=Caballeronia sp. 15711 TaxID=3391029 RepID=UPI0039E600D6